MDDALLVGGFERLGDLPRDREGLVDRDRTLRNPVGQRHPSTSSITRAVMPPARSMPKMSAMFG